MSFKLSCNIVSYGAYQSIAFEHLETIGVRNVEFSVPPRKGVDELLERLEKHRLVATTMIADCPIQSEDVVERFHEPVHIANQMGTGILFVSVHSGEVPLETIYERLRKVGDVAGDHGVKIAIETHPNLADSGEVARQTMEAVNHPAVGIDFDTANVLYYADEPTDTVEELKKVLPWVVSVHLKDYSSDKPRQWAFPTLGQGFVNFKEVFRLLAERDFDGPTTLELEGVEGETLSEEQMKERVAESVRVAKAAMEAA